MRKAILAFILLVAASVLVYVNLGVPRNLRQEYNVADCGDTAFHGLHVVISQNTLTVTDIQSGPTLRDHLDKPIVFKYVGKRKGVVTLRSDELGAEIRLTVIKGNLIGQVKFADGVVDDLAFVSHDISQLSEDSLRGFQACLNFSHEPSADTKTAEQ